jgi:ferredoxin
MGRVLRLNAMFKEVAVRVIVDRDRCEGNAVCLGIAPDIFELDDEDYAVRPRRSGRTGNRRMPARCVVAR